MVKELFGPMELDALGEMMNISLGSSATAVSNMLEHRVDITTPKVTVVDVADFQLGNLEPAMGVEIKYVEGLDGSNIMLLRRSDVKVIVDILMGSETPEEEFELNELTISAVCEVMNQMMGAAATAMSDFLGYPVNISTPEPFELDDIEAFKAGHLPQGADTVVVVRFSLKIENTLESEFMNVMSVTLAKDLLKGLGLGDLEEEPIPEPAPAASSGGVMSQDEIEKMLAGMNSEPAPAPAPAPQMQQPAPAAPAPQAQQPAPQAQQPAAPYAPPPGQPPMYGYPPAEGAPYGYPPPMEGMPYGYPAYPPIYYGYPGYPGYPPMQEPPAPPEPKLIPTTPVDMKEMQGIASLGKEQSENLDLIMEVPLQVTVEIGRTRRKVQDILEFSKGSLVVLDKLAGDQVDLFVNGKCIAKGDVVVVDDNFGVRITEIVQKTGLEATMGNKK